MLAGWDVHVVVITSSGLSFFTGDDLSTLVVKDNKDKKRDNACNATAESIT